MHGHLNVRYVDCVKSNETNNESSNRNAKEAIVMNIPFFFCIFSTEDWKMSDGSSLQSSSRLPRVCR